MTSQIPEHEEVISLKDLPEEEPEQAVVSSYVANLHEIGDVLQLGETQEIPEGWHELDGSDLPSYEWPQFTQAMKINTATFALPKPERALPGHRFIIKLGQHRERPPAPEVPLVVPGLNMRPKTPEEAAKEVADGTSSAR